MTQSPKERGDRLDNPSLLNQFNRPEVVVRKGPGQPAHTNALPIVFDIQFDEPVVDFPLGFSTGGIVFSGTASGLQYEVTGAKAAYRVTVRAIEEDGSLALSVPDELAADLFGNPNRASTGEEALVHYDITRPRCVIQSEQEGVMNDARMNIALVFSEPVFGLRDDALAVENATLNRIGGEDGDATYHFAVTPHADGTTAMRVPEDAAHDAVGNGNEASPAFSLVVDSTGPQVALSSFETPRKSNSWVIRVHATFNEPVYGFERGDVEVQGGRLLNFTARDDGMTYLFDVRPEASWVHVRIPEDVARDAIGNPNAPSEPFTREIDRERPAVAIEAHQDQAPPGQPVPVTVTFSEPVYGFEADELDASRASIYRTAGEDGDAVYQYLVAPEDTRRVTLRVRSDRAADLAGNPNRDGSTTFTPRPPREREPEEPGTAAPPLRN